MDCPNCGGHDMRTLETFKTPEKTYRTKQCTGCKWKYTSHEVIADEYAIPRAVRDLKRSEAGYIRSGRPGAGPRTPRVAQSPPGHAP